MFTNFDPPGGGVTANGTNGEKPPTDAAARKFYLQKYDKPR